MKSTLTLCFAWVLLANSTCIAATVLNGSFEDPVDNFNNWLTTGIATVKTSPFGDVNPVNSPDGANQALIRTDRDGAGADVTVGNLANFLSIPEAQLSALATDTITRGSGLKQAVTGVNVGDVVTVQFSWNYLTSEIAGNTNNDFGFFSVSSANGQTASYIEDANVPGYIADTNAAGMTSFSSPDNLFSRQTGYRTASYTFTPGGDFTFGFGIVNVTDTTFSSGLLIDSVSLTAVPEPTALAGLGLVGLALTLRRRKEG